MSGLFSATDADNPPPPLALLVQATHRELDALYSRLDAVVSLRGSHNDLIVGIQRCAALPASLPCSALLCSALLCSHTVNVQPASQSVSQPVSSVALACNQHAHLVPTWSSLWLQHAGQRAACARCGLQAHGVRLQLVLP